jgi:phosphohistidine phosphatase
MNLYLLRHGIAVPNDDPENVPDSDRPLTPKGVKRMRKAAKGLRRLGIPFDSVLTSPLVRARQTAEIVAQALGLGDHLEELSALAPGNSVSDLWSGLTPYQDHEHLLLVGHEPFLSTVLSYLLTHDEKRSVTVDFKKGGLCRVEITALPPNKSGILHWLLTAKQLRALAGPVE